MRSAIVGWVGVLVLSAGAAAVIRAQGVPDLYADQFESALLDVEVSDVAGAPLAGVSVSIGSGPATLTDANGEATLTVGAGATQVVRFTRAGYTDQMMPLYFQTRIRRAFVRAQMMPRAPDQVIANIEAGATLTGPDGAVLTLPPNALVGPGGAPVAGSVTISVTPVDVSGPELGAFPGAFEGTAVGGARVPIASFGTVEYLITQAGQPLQLANGVVAAIDIPVYPALREDGMPVAGGQVLPLWFLDEHSGLWSEQGTANVIASAASPTGFAARGNVGHFSWWNIDVAYNPGFIRVRGFAPANHAIAPNVDAHVAAVSIGGGPGSIATTDFPADMRSLPLPVPPERDIAVGLCTYVVTAGPPEGTTLLLACGTATANVLPQAVQNVDVPLQISGQEPVILLEPLDRTVLETTSAQFTVQAQSPDGSLLRYQWRKNGATIAGANSAVYNTPPTVLADNGNLYSVVVSNDSGDTTSRSALLTITAAPTPTIVQPPDPICTRDATLTFSIVLAPGTSADMVDLRRAPPPGAQFLTVGSDLTAPYEIAWNTAPEAEDTYVVVARAHVGANRIESATRTVRVDRTIPTITAREPAPGSQQDAGAPITFTLDSALDAATVVDANVVLRVNGVEAGKSLAISPDGRTVTVTPAVAGLAGQYEVSVANIADCAGNVMLPDAWAFEILAFAQLGTVVNLNDVGNGRQPSVAYDYQGVPWVSYTQDESGTANDRVMARRFENGAWTIKGGVVNATPAVSSGLTLSRIVVDEQDRAVVAFLQTEGAIAKLRVRRFDNQQWNDLGSAPLNVTTGNAQNPMIAMGDQDRPIVAWIENGRIRVKRWDETSATWLALGPAEVAFASQVGLATLDGVPYLSWGEFHSPAGNAVNYTINAARYDEAQNVFVSLFSDFRAAISVNHASIAVANVDSPYVAHGDTPFVVSGAPQQQILRLVRRQAGAFEVVLPTLAVDPNGLANISDAEFLGPSPVFAFLETVRDPVTGQVGLPRLYIRVGTPGGFTVEPATITGATDLGIPDLAANPSGNFANGHLAVVFSRANGRIAFKFRP